MHSSLRGEMVLTCKSTLHLSSLKRPLSTPTKHSAFHASFTTTKTPVWWSELSCSTSFPPLYSSYLFSHPTLLSSLLFADCTSRRYSTAVFLKLSTLSLPLPPPPLLSPFVFTQSRCSASPELWMPATFLFFPIR